MPDVVLRELRDAIIDSRIAQGDQLHEVELASMFGTSRGVIREASRQLVQEGLVDHVPHRGAFVRTLTIDDAIDVYTARLVIESGAARLALAESDGLDVSTLAEAIARMRAVKGSRGRANEEMIAADIDFHRRLVALSRSARLARTHETLMAETAMLLRHQPVYPAADYVADHTKLLVAFERRDPQTPELVAEHLRLSVRLIVEELERESAERTRQRDRRAPRKQPMGDRK